MREISIREYANEDLREFADNAGEWQGSITSLYASLSKHNGDIEKCFIAVSNTEIVGLVYGFALPNFTLIPEFVYVLPKFRRKGIASELIKTLENSAKCTSSMIFYNKDLRNFYAKQNYTIGENIEVALKLL